MGARPQMRQERTADGMKLYSEKRLHSFEFWSGAKDRAAMLTDEELDAVETNLEELYPDGMDEMTVNDLFWFDFESVCEWIGLPYNPETDEIDRGADDDEDEAEEETEE